MRTIHWQPDALNVELSGMEKFEALAGHFRIPYENIAQGLMGVEVPDHLLRLGGTSLGSLKEGHFEAMGLWYFLSFRHPEHVVTLELKNFKIGHHRYAAAAIEVEDPDTFLKELQLHLVSA